MAIEHLPGVLNTLNYWQDNYTIKEWEVTWSIRPFSTFLSLSNIYSTFNHNLKTPVDMTCCLVESFPFNLWMLHDTDMIHSWCILDTSCDSSTYIFFYRSSDFQCILLVVFLSICYIYDTYLMYSWHMHAWRIYSKLERKRLLSVN